MSDNYEYSFKIILIGDTHVGKSTIFPRLNYNISASSIQSTIGVDYHINYFDIDNKKIRLEIWDTAGQESFRSITNYYFKSCSGILLFVDINDRNSFTNLNRWIDDVQNKCDKNVPRILVGNKIDLEREVTYDEITDFAFKNDFLYCETSLTYDKDHKKGIVRIMEKIGKLILKRVLDGEKLPGIRSGTSHIFGNAETEINMSESNNCCIIM
jgi:Ras-related protein Rab-2A